MNEQRSQQLRAILRLEWKKSFFNRRAWWIYVLAAGPAVVAGLHSLLVMRGRNLGCTLSIDSEVFAGIFQLFYLRLGIFFGCVGLFSNLIRGEMLSKTLHYYFLTPVRREVVIFGKYLAGLLAAGTIFGVSVAATFYLITLHYGPEQTAFFMNGPGAAHLYWYVLTTILACAGYGAVFLASGLIVRNPLIPAAVIMVWEGGSTFLPALLQKLTIIYYLKSLCPVAIRLQGMEALLSISVDPAPPVLVITGLLALSALILTYAGFRSRRAEIHYYSE